MKNIIYQKIWGISSPFSMDLRKGERCFCKRDKLEKTLIEYESRIYKYDNIKVIKLNHHNIIEDIYSFDDAYRILKLSKI